MGAETEVIEHTVTVADASVTREGFGTPLIAAVHNFWPERVRTFESADDMLLAPFNVPVTHAVYKSARAFKSQETSPPELKVGKLTGSIAQSIELVPSAPSAGEVFSLTVDGQPVSATADGTPTLAEIVAALTTAISALPDVTAVDGSTKVTVNGDTAGIVHALEALTSNLKLRDVTALAATTVAADLAAIRGADDDWYALHLANGGEAAINDAAAWAETQRVLFIAQTSDSGVLDSAVTTDIASDIKTAGYHRTAVLYHHRIGSQHPAAAWEGRMLPKLPGPVTFANKGLASVDVSTLDATARAALRGKKANYYIPIKGLGFTLHGTAGSGRRLDVTVAMDWFDVGIEDRIILLMRNNDVVPYTKKGIELCRAQIEAQVLEGIRLGIIDGEQKWFATAPAIGDINAADKADRLLPDLKYSYVLSGSIEKVRINGTVQV